MVRGVGASNVLHLLRAQVGSRGLQRPGDPSGKPRRGPLGAGAPYSSKRPPRAQPCQSGLSLVLCSQRRTQSLCPTIQGKLSQRALPFSREPEAGGGRRAAQEEPLSVCREAWPLPGRTQSSSSSRTTRMWMRRRRAGSPQPL